MAVSQKPRTSGPTAPATDSRAEVVVAAVDASTRCVFRRHAEKMGCTVITEVGRLDDLLQELSTAQHHNCGCPLMVFVGERTWEAAIAKLQMNVRPLKSLFLVPVRLYAF
eukprot:Skav232018  [mRNA]  locus=scaffold3326:40490:44602:- [translate_table: standard]